jgi:two-component system response regulator RegA
MEHVTIEAEELLAGTSVARARCDSRPTVVLADTCQMQSSTLAIDFRKRGFDVECCRTGRELLRLAKDEAQIVVTELRLDDGPCLAQIEAVKAAVGCKVVVVTHYASIATAVHCARRGVEAYLEKPATVGDILDALAGDRFIPESVPDQPMRLDRAIWEYINHAVDAGGSITAGARLIGVDRRSLRRMLSKYAPPANNNGAAVARVWSPELASGE